MIVSFSCLSGFLRPASRVFLVLRDSDAGPGVSPPCEFFIFLSFFLIGVRRAFGSPFLGIVSCYLIIFSPVTMSHSNKNSSWTFRRPL